MTDYKIKDKFGEKSKKYLRNVFYKNKANMYSLDRIAVKKLYCSTNFAWCNVLERVNDFSQIEKNESPTYSCWFYKMEQMLI